MRLNVDAQVGWHADFYRRSPLFEPLAETAAHFCDFSHWPALADYQHLLDALAEPIKLMSGKPLRIVAQAGKPHSFADHYAPRIYLSGELQTRSKNWHDFFQFLTWFLFPRTKAQINALHLPLARQRLDMGETGRRTPLENMLSLFDEGGAVIAASDPSLLQLIREFRWKELFWQRRAELAQTLHCITFGHALYEKGLTPYVGMTANTILLEVAPHYFELPLAERVKHVDAQLVALLREGTCYTKPRDLHPFPILGMPDWHAANKHELFYDNHLYFRPGRGQ
ncbi:MAG TPA: DUF3025 domain-containing protein [Gammaproteobacteria bacterium]